MKAIVDEQGSHLEGVKRHEIAGYRCNAYLAGNDSRSHLRELARVDCRSKDGNQSKPEDRVPKEGE